MTLKIGAISKRKPRKLTLSLPPHLDDALEDYVAIHAREHGDGVSANDIALRMIEEFLEKDRGFKRARKQLHSASGSKE
ncbi:MAG: DUF2274 domain-containing protein [Pseudomonadota bacterium]